MSFSLPVKCMIRIRTIEVKQFVCSCLVRIIGNEFACISDRVGEVIVTLVTRRITTFKVVHDVVCCVGIGNIHCTSI